MKRRCSRRGRKAPRPSDAEKIIQGARQRHRTLLTEAESKQLLAAYGIATIETQIASSEDAAVELAEKSATRWC